MLSESDRLRGLFRLGWAVHTHFVNFDLVPDLDWEQAVVETIPAVQQTPTLAGYYRVLRRLAARLCDGHTFVVEPDAPRATRGRPALELASVEGQPAVTWAAAELQEIGLRSGTVIRSVDGRPASDVLAELHEEVSASTDHGRRAHALQQLLIGPRDEPVTVTADDGSGPRPHALPRTVGVLDPSTVPPIEARRLDHGHAYLAINTFNRDDVVALVDKALDAVLDARGLVVDLRRNGGGNGAWARAIAGRLTDRPLQFEHARTRQTLSSFTAAGWPAMFMDIAPAVQPPRPHPFLGALAVLTGPLTASAAEDFLVGLDDTGRAALVGEPTNGSTGQPLKVALPTDGQAFVCTRRCRYPDGSEFVGRGIAPDIAAAPTLAGLRAGRDEVLEAAVSWLVGQRV